MTKEEAILKNTEAQMRVIEAALKEEARCPKCGEIIKDNEDNICGRCI